MNPGTPEFHESVLNLEDPVSAEFAREFQEATLNKPIDESWLQTLVNESLKLPARIWKAAMNGIMEADYTAELKNIQKPTMIFLGEKDAFCYLKDQEELLYGIAGAQLKIYKGTGHALHWEEPVQFFRDLQEFIGSK